MRSRIEQDHEQYPPFALILPRGAANAPLPGATSAAAAVHSHPVTRNGNRRAHSHEAFEGGLAEGCRSTADCGFDPRLPSRGGPLGALPLKGLGRMNACPPLTTAPHQMPLRAENVSHRRQSRFEERKFVRRF
jgi:hypothetical protein